MTEGEKSRRSLPAAGPLSLCSMPIRIVGTGTLLLVRDHLQSGFRTFCCRYAVSRQVKEQTALSAREWRRKTCWASRNSPHVNQGSFRVSATKMHLCIAHMPQLCAERLTILLVKKPPKQPQKKISPQKLVTAQCCPCLLGNVLESSITSFL